MSLHPAKPHRPLQDSSAKGLLDGTRTVQGRYKDGTRTAQGRYKDGRRRTIAPRRVTGFVVYWHGAESSLGHGSRRIACRTLIQSPPVLRLPYVAAFVFVCYILFPKIVAIHSPAEFVELSGMLCIKAFRIIPRTWQRSCPRHFCAYLTQAAQTGDHVLY